MKDKCTHEALCLHWLNKIKDGDGALTAITPDILHKLYCPCDHHLITLDADELLEMLMGDIETHEGDTTMTFSEALDAMKNGKRVARKGWNGQEQYINIVGIGEIFCDGERFRPHNKDIDNKAIAFHGTRGIQVGWLASQSDMLAEDWIIKEK